MKKKVSIIALLLSVFLLFTGCDALLTDEYSLNPSKSSVASIESETTADYEIPEETPAETENQAMAETPTEANKTDVTYTPAILHESVSASGIPAFSGKAYIEINGNVPDFSDKDYTTTSYEYYSDLDSLGRCGVAIACIGQDLMPTEERGSIGQVKPTGWHTVKYDCVDGKYLYNRCHLIGFQLSGENANEKNLITGTRYMNVDGMLPFENMVADYVKETGNHVLYRVTPVFEGNNLLATGVQIEGYSIEDEGDGIFFNVFVYNAQPEININYATGDSSYIEPPTEKATEIVVKETEAAIETVPETEAPPTTSYILNTNTKKFHYPDCYSVDRMSEKNKEYFTGSRQEVIDRGYSPCGNCNP